MAVNALFFLSRKSFSQAQHFNSIDTSNGTHSGQITSSPKVNEESNRYDYEAYLPMQRQKKHAKKC